MPRPTLNRRILSSPSAADDQPKEVLYEAAFTHKVALKTAVQDIIEDLSCPIDNSDPIVKSKIVDNETFQSIRPKHHQVIDVRVLVINEDKKLLIRDAKSPEYWIEPGGTPLQNEGYEETAVREVREETGIICNISSLRGIVVHKFIRKINQDQSTELLQLFFISTAESISISINPTEVLQAKWWKKLPENYYSDFPPNKMS